MRAKRPGDGAARGLGTVVTSGPADRWVTPDDAFFYQIYGNAAKLIGYVTQPVRFTHGDDPSGNPLQQSHKDGGILTP